MAIEIKIPFLGDGIDTVTVASWQCKTGDLIAQGDEVAEVEADKALFSVASEGRGRLAAILVAEGQKAAVGQPIAILQSE